MMDKYICTNCHQKIYDNEMLVATHPFDEREKIYGCPSCKDVVEIYRACDEDKCWSKGTCGRATPNGYLSLCGRHYDIEEEKSKC